MTITIALTSEETAQLEAHYGVTGEAEIANRIVEPALRALENKRVSDAAIALRDQVRTELSEKVSVE